MDKKLYDVTLSDYFAELLAEFRSISRSEVSAWLAIEIEEPGKSVAEAWRKADPHTPEEVTAFYRETDSYLYDLAADHCSSVRRPVWDVVVERIERHGRYRNVLLYGDGIGTDSIALARRGHKVTYYDLPGTTSEFARFRFAREELQDRIAVITDAREILPESFDAVVCIEVLEHVVDPVGTMKDLYAALRTGGIALITESFESIGPDYPSHLPGNFKYAGKTHRLMERLGFASTYYNYHPINRPMEFVKKAPNLAGELLGLRGRLRRVVHTRWRYIAG
jgi:SAM-dependent methyltransferase